MSHFSFPFLELPIELQGLILSFLDFPNIITILTVSKHIQHLAKEQPLLRDPEMRIRFLLAMEEAPENTNKRRSETFPGDEWRWPNHSPRNHYVCFFCKKLKPLRKFAHGQCYRMQISNDYSQERKRFCLECGVKDLNPQAAGPLARGGRKYLPGAMINSVDYGYKVHLCGGCGEWSRDFFCMKDKLCFTCTETELTEPEKFVEGYQKEARGVSASTAERALDDELLKMCGVWEELLARFRIDEETWPRRPPCCRKCGGVWRFHPHAFGWHFEPDTNCRGKTVYKGKPKRPVIWRHGYKISGRASHEIIDRGRRNYTDEDYMSWFCPFPNHSWTLMLDSGLYGDIRTAVYEAGKASTMAEVLD